MCLVFAAKSQLHYPPHPPYPPYSQLTGVAELRLKLPAVQIRDLAALRWLHAGESVLVYGPVGVGKTHLAQALGHLAVRTGAEARFHKTSKLLVDLAGGHADGTFTKRLAAHAKPAVLILDDFALREFTAQQADDLYELVSQRVADGNPLIITANRAPQYWYPLFPNPVVAGLPRPPDQHEPPGIHERTLLQTRQTLQGQGADHRLSAVLPITAVGAKSLQRDR